MIKLTDEQIKLVCRTGMWDDSWQSVKFARAIEAEVLRINGGGGEAVNVSKIIDAAVSKFLGWKLPFDFAPDAGISYDKSYRDKWGLPSGTNLLNALQAKYMFECCLREALPQITDSVNVAPTTDMCRAAVEYVNGAGIYEKVPPSVTEIEEEIYREVWLAMQKKAPQQAAPGAVLVGWQMVPVEPTAEMLKAATENYKHPERWLTERTNVYKRMLSAAPKPQGE